MSSPLRLPKVALTSSVQTSVENFGTFVAGGTQYHINAWLTLTRDPFEINNIKGVKIDLHELPHQEAVPEAFCMSKSKKDLITNVVKEHLEKGIIEKCTPTEGQYISNVFLKPKPYGNIG